MSNVHNNTVHLSDQKMLFVDLVKDDPLPQSQTEMREIRTAHTDNHNSQNSEIS